MSGKKILISVIICTYNRADLLADALQTICQQTLDFPEYEVIVVDNNSTDETATISQSFVRDYSNVRYCFEPRQGLSHARNRGWQEAKGEYVGYIDDDCKVPQGYLTVAKEIIESFSPSAFGGPYFGFYNTPKPHWFKDSYGSYEPYKTADFIKKADIFHGCNFFVERQIFVSLSGFDEILGMNGEKTAYGEETALLMEIQATIPDAVFYYDPRLFVYHLLRQEQMTWRWIIPAHFAQGRNSNFIYPSSNSKFRFILPLVKYSLALVFSLPFGLFFRSRKQYPYFQNFLYEVSCHYIYRLGLVYGHFLQLIAPQTTST